MYKKFVNYCVPYVLAAVLIVGSVGFGAYRFTSIAKAAPTFVQNQAFGPFFCGSLTYPSNVTVGNTLVIVLATAGGSGATVSSITDTRGNTFTSFFTKTGLFFGDFTAYYAPVTTGGSDTITINGTSLTNNVNAELLEFSGISASPSDGGNGQNNFNKNAGDMSSSGSVTTSAGGDLMVDFAIRNNGAWSPTTFTSIDNSCGQDTSYLVVGAAGSYAGGYTLVSGASVSNSEWVVAMLAGGGGGGVATVDAIFFAGD